MSWYLADKKNIIDQFATTQGLADLVAAAKPYQTLTQFLTDGSTDEVAACIVELNKLAKGKVDTDVAATAKGLAKMMKGEVAVWITQGFGAPASVKAKESEARSLQHPDHAKLLKPIYRKVKKLMAGYFERQGEEILQAVKPWLKLHMKESEAPSDDAQTLAQTILPDTLQPFLLAASTQESSDYRGLIQDAINKAAAQLETEIQSGATIPETAMGRYLEQNSLSKLTGEISETTKQQLRDAIADAVQGGGTADDIVNAIQDTMENFSSVRANMIAQTETNDAYNFGRKQMATSAGFDEKVWVIESDNPCLICIANAAEGYVDIDAEFLSGDDAPTAHPNCYCSLDFRKVT